MARVAKALAGFASRDGNRLVVTSNLTNASIVTKIFETTGSEGGSEWRSDRILNLLKVAAPNRALTEDRERYEELLHDMVFGTRQ